MNSKYFKLDYAVILDGLFVRNIFVLLGFWNDINNAYNWYAAFQVKSDLEIASDLAFYFQLLLKPPMDPDM